MGDHILVVESGQSDARGLAVMAAAKQAIPNKPIRFVVNSHPHFDHASGLAAAVAEGATILTHRNNEEVLERLLSRSAHADRRQPVEGARLAVRMSSRGSATATCGKGNNGKVVELHRIPNEHSDGMLVVYSAGREGRVVGGHHCGQSQPGSAGSGEGANETLNKLKLDYNTWIPAHPPNPDKPLTKADVAAAAGTK